MEKLHDVFISYQSNDLEKAQQLFDELSKHGLDTWFDKVRLKPGFQWHNEIEAGCRKSRILIPILTPNWLQSKWTKFETYGAETIIPVVYDETWSNLLTPPLSKFQVHKIDFTDKESIAELINSIQVHLKKDVPVKKERVLFGQALSNKPDFTGRENELIQLHESINKLPSTKLTIRNCVCITGLGGVGKTTLAREYVEEFWRCYDQVFWVDAFEDIVGQFAKLADRIDPSNNQANDAEKAAYALNKLNEERVSRLLIINNAEDEISVKKWIPVSGACHVIITSRFNNWSAEIETLPLYVWEPIEACEFLFKRTAINFSEKTNTDCKLLAGTLGYLPLALVQAAAFIKQNGRQFGFDDYLEKYKKYEAELLAEPILEGFEYMAVYTTWKTTADHLSENARSILRQCSFLSPDLIPIEMIVKGANSVLNANSLANKKEKKDWLIEKGILELSSYSMINMEGKQFYIHPLVQEVERLSEKKKSLYFSRSQKIIETYAPANAHHSTHWDIWSLVQPHVFWLWKIINNDTTIPVNPALMFKLYKWYWGNAMFNEGVIVGDRVMQEYEKDDEKNKLKIADCLINVGEGHRWLGNKEKAKGYFKRAIDIYKNKDGESSANVATSYIYHGLALSDLGEAAEAKKNGLDAFEILKELKKPNNTDCIKCTGLIAGIYEDENDFSNAEKFWKLSLQYLNNPDEDPDPWLVLATYYNIALFYSNNNNDEEAEKYFKLAIESGDKLNMGAHPHMARVLFSQGKILKTKGFHAEALILIERAESILKDKLDKGTATQELLLIYLELGLMYNDIKKYDESRNAYLEAEKLLSKLQLLNTFTAARVYNNYAFLLYELGLKEEAILKFEQSASASSIYPNPWYWLAKLYNERNKEGDMAKEHDAWKMYLKLGPTSGNRKAEADKRILELESNHA